MRSTARLFHWFSPLKAISLVAIFVLALSACAPTAATQSSSNQPASSSGYGSNAQPTATTAAIPVTGSEATISVVSDAKLGNILVDGKGMTLYGFTKDGPNQSNCTGQCLKNWPALSTQGHPNLGNGVDPSLVGSAKLADGSMVVTYNKMPLYTFYKDTKPGDTNGQGVGTVWFTVSPDGKLVGQAASPSVTGSPAATSPAAVTEAAINVATDPKLGKILVGANGMTLYMFAKDTPDKSNCSAGCLKAWPPLLTLGNPKLGDGVDASLVGSTSLADGSKIVTYNHMPLYYFVKDTKPGDTIGQGNGNVWYVVSPDGKPVGMDNGAITPAASSAASEASISVVTNAKYGKILADGKGMTLYVFTVDQPDKSNCTGQCLQNWPPLVTQGHPNVGYGVDSSLVGSASLPDGTKVVTYAHMPLYTFAKDSKPGDTNGQGVGSVWFMIAPDGSMIKQ